MERSIKIGKQQINLKSSVYTFIDYENTFGSDLQNDLNVLASDNNSIGKTLEVIFKLLYILNKPFRERFIGFQDFCQGFEIDAIVGENMQELAKVINELLAPNKKTP